MENNKELLKEIAVIALYQLKTAKWIAQDKNGQWFTYEFKPTADEYEWAKIGGRFETLMWLEEPANFKAELYEISKLLKNDN